MQLEGAKLVHEHELRMRMDAAIGRTPPLEDGELQVSTAPALEGTCSFWLRTSCLTSPCCALATAFS